MSADPTHDEFRFAIGPYVLGHLDDHERAWLEEHLASCVDCAAELRELMPVAGLLREAAPATGVADAGGGPPPDLGVRVESAIHDLAADERRRRVLRLAVGAGAIGIAASAVFYAGSLVGGDDSPSTPAIPLEHVNVTTLERDIVADADIVAHTWGVEVKLHGSGFGAGEAYDVSVVSADGIEHPAGEFVGTGDQAMNCNLNSSVLRDAATGFEVRDDTGTVVLTSSFAPAP